MKGLAHSDPVEAVVAKALDDAGIPYTRNGSAALDFELLDGSGVYIECKRMFTHRISNQMQRAPRMIVIQSLEAAEWFAEHLKRPETS